MAGHGAYYLHTLTYTSPHPTTTTTSSPLRPLHGRHSARAFAHFPPSDSGDTHAAWQAYLSALRRGAFRAGRGGIAVHILSAYLTAIVRAHVSLSTARTTWRSLKARFPLLPTFLLGRTVLATRASRATFPSPRLRTPVPPPTPAETLSATAHFDVPNASAPSSATLPAMVAKPFHIFFTLTRAAGTAWHRHHCRPASPPFVPSFY